MTVKLSSNLLSVIAAGVLLAATTSCSILNRPTKTATKVQEKETSESVTKTDRTKTAVKDSGNKAIASSDEQTKKIAGEWTIVKVGKSAVQITDEMPYVNFDKADGRFYASDGCNIINGDFTITKDNILHLDNVLSTMRMCPEIENGSAISSALNGAQPLTVGFTKANSEDVTMMTLANPQGKVLLTLRRSDMNFLNGQWQVVKIGATSYDNPEINLFFDLPALKVHGNTGCNFFNGDIYIDPTVGASLNFGRMGVTRMACPDSGTETAMLVALEQVCSARPGTGDTVLLNDASGTTLMVLKRMPTTD